MQKYFGKIATLATIVCCLTLISNSSQARYITGYPELLALYARGLKNSQKAAIKDSIEEAETNALNDIFRNKFNTMSAKIQFMMRRSRESIPTKVFNIDDKYLAVGFEKTIFTQAAWEKTAYLLLFEIAESRSLNYLDAYLFWRGTDGIKEYQKISKSDLCKQFFILSRMTNCEKEVTGTTTAAKPVAPSSKGAPDPEAKSTSIPASAKLTEIKALQSEVDSLKADLKKKADRRHTHSGRDIKSGIIKETFIDPSIPREEKYDPTQTVLTDVDDVYVKRLEKRVAELESTVFELTSLLRGVYRNGDNLIISSANLQIVNGTGTTDGPDNSVGNLIVGYNEPREKDSDNIRTGSHNIVVGSNNSYASHGGIVAGLNNTISGKYSSVTGGTYNTAGGDFSIVTGGNLVSTNDLYSVVPNGAGGGRSKSGGCGGCGGCGN